VAGVPRREGARGEERRGAVGAVWRGGDGGTFDRGGEAVVGRGDGRRCTIKAPITLRGDDGAVTIHGEIEEESVACRFSSIRVLKGVHRQRRLRAVAWSSAGGGRRPGWAGVGPSALGPKVDRDGFGGKQKNGGGPHEGMGRNQIIKKNWLFKWFQIYLRFRIQKSKDSKYF
jgi:hypothetical protein